MGKGTILRVQERTELPTPVVTALNSILPDCKQEFFTKKPNYQESIQRRMESLYSAFLFLLEAYPPDPKKTPITAETLKSYVDEVKAAINLQQKTLNEMHLALEKFTAAVVETISIGWPGDDAKASQKQAIHALNQAEQYVIMQQGRPNLATITPMEFAGKTEYVLQYDESLSPLYPQLVDELNTLGRLGYPTTPSWFQNLPPYQKAFFLNAPADESLNLQQEFMGFKKEWTEEIAPSALDINADLQKIACNTPPLPGWYQALKPPIKAMMKILAENPGTVASNLAEFKTQLTALRRQPAFAATITHIVKLPEWYWVLCEREQCFLKHVLKSAASVEEAVSYLSSRHRTLPAPANFAVHNLFRINEEGVVSKIGQERYRSSHIASRDMIQSSSDVQMRHVTSNLAKVMENARPGQPRLEQTLISPIFGLDIGPAVLTKKLPPDLALFNMSQVAIARSQYRSHIVFQNHPFNHAKYVFPTLADNENSKQLIAKASDFTRRNPVLRNLIEEYQRVLKQSLSSSTLYDYNGRELFLSSLEQLIIMNMDAFSHGTCASGKDRKAVELMHTDAMLLYKEKYGAWPKFEATSSDRLNFVAIVADIYVSRHQHVHAGQNAPGSEGIKTPNWYFPSDIQEVINRRYAQVGIDCGLSNDDRLATDNEVKNISTSLKTYFLKAQQLVATLMTRQIGEQNCKSLYDALLPLINEVQQFKAEETGVGASLASMAGNFVSMGGKLSFFGATKGDTTPTGIDQIRTVVASQRSGSSNSERLSAIFRIVLERPVYNPSRTKATNAIYNGVRSLYAAYPVGESVAQRVKGLISNWQCLFAEIKRTNSSQTLSSLAFVDDDVDASSSYTQ